MERTLEAEGADEEAAFRSRGHYEWVDGELVLLDSSGNEVLAGAESGRVLRLSDGKNVYEFSRLQ